MADIQSKLSSLTLDNAKLKAKLVDAEGRSRRYNIRVVGLLENIEGSMPTAFVLQLLFEVLGADILTSPPELERAHRSLVANPGLRRDRGMSWFAFTASRPRSLWCGRRTDYEES